ncbi:dockerin type I domain-containing protein [Ruminococcus flavefaciens]|uniref:Dockerin domain-containing protein n=1 Tax=Ruminococcus flavefaciens TaxID=1265 RepID=A0A1M7LZS1_RUMFL|nr:dockerin type I domain-containing protein [Ruminococcus flavefaciens]SHM83347.1 hypothetical protein SAMN04487860_1171 [Ruminococcus flavefaciens]
MKQFIRKIVSVTTAAIMLLSATALQAVAAEAAKGDKYDLTGIDLSKATVKPTVLITQQNISYNEAKDNPVRTIQIYIKDAEGKYANAGFSVKVDERLELVKDEDGEIAYAGPALKRAMFTAVPEGDNGFRAIIAGSDAKSYDGVMFEFKVKLPEDFVSFEKYPIDIYYNKDTDLFTNELMDEDGKLMEAWIFSQGIIPGYIYVESDPSHDIPPKGDVNFDRKVDSVDASMILALYSKVSTGKTEPTKTQFRYYDYNGDGMIDSVDASNVLKVYAANSTE